MSRGVEGGSGRLVVCKVKQAADSEFRFRFRVGRGRL